MQPCVCPSAQAGVAALDCLDSLCWVLPHPFTTWMQLECTATVLTLPVADASCSALPTSWYDIAPSPLSVASVCKRNGQEKPRIINTGLWHKHVLIFKNATAPSTGLDQGLPFDWGQSSEFGLNLEEFGMSDMTSEVAKVAGVYLPLQFKLAKMVSVLLEGTLFMACLKQTQKGNLCSFPSLIGQLKNKYLFLYWD